MDDLVKRFEADVLRLTELTELVQPQVALAQKAGVLTVPPRWRRIPVILCVDACPLWRTSATRADVFVGVWPGGPRAAGVPANGGNMVGDGRRR